ncbi:MAG TPA: hypothetical protein VMN82_10945 [Thermoanaerobaculia bacterium]|nr:hypothetical protein [Thermoanaerobaculia bacterium]
MIRRTSTTLTAGLLLASAARAQQDPIEVGIRLIEALAATAAAQGAAGPKSTPTPLPFKEPKPLEVQPDWSSVDAIVTALYASVSHGPDSEPNWTRLRNLFLPQAIVVPPKPPDAEAFTVLDGEKFEARVRRYIAGRRERHERLGFTEREIARREHRFGSVCQVFSTYETLYAPHDPQPFARGVHSIQLVDDGRRWWIAALAWDVERPDRPIPPDLRPTEIPSRPGS